MEKFKTKGFPWRVSNYIEIPRIEELLLMPFVNSIDAESLYKIGGDFYREILDKAPITNSKKYVSVQASVKLLTPSVSPVINDYALDREWHVDGNDNFIEDDVIMHIISNKTSSMTEFNTTPFEEWYDTANDLIAECNDMNSVTHKKLVGKKIEPNKIYTFNNTDIHRANRVVKPEFRFFFRIVESDLDEPNNNFGNSYVFHGSRESIENMKQIYKDGKVDKIIITRY